MGVSEGQSIAMPVTLTATAVEKRKARVVSPFPMTGTICLDTIFTEAHGAKTQKEGFAMSPREVADYIPYDPVLGADLKSFEDFYLAPLHLARPNKSNAVTAATHEGYVKALRELWGYQAKYCEQDKRCDVFAVMNGPLLLRYIAFRKVQQGNAAVTLKRMITQLKAVMKWCTLVGLKDDAASVDEVEAANTLCEHVSILSAQIGATAPIKQPVDVAQRALAGKTIEWKTLRANTKQFAAATLKMVRALYDPTQNASRKADRLKGAFRLNTSLFGLLYAGLLNVGPPRPFAIKALVVVGAQGADEAHGPDCSVCSNVECVGNVLKKIGDEEFRIHSTHHKMARRTRQVIPAISIKKAIDPLAWGIVDEIFKWGHTALVDHYDPCHENSSPDDRRRAFRTLENGRVYDVQSGSETMHSLAVVRLVAELVGVPQKELHVTCNELRHMYVSWYKGLTKAATGGNGTSRLTPAEEEGAAIAMGTSVRMWDTVYHDTHRQSLVDDSRDVVRRQYAADDDDDEDDDEDDDDDADDADRVCLLPIITSRFDYYCLVSGSVILQLITHRLTE
jgi:hypothetical protein